MITGEYYNEYIILDKDSLFIKLEKEASFDEIYFDEIDGITIIEN